MSQWHHQQPYNNACQSFNNCYRYPPLPFNEQRMTDPRGFTTPVCFPPGDRPPPPRPPMQPPPVGPAIGRPPVLPPFPPCIPPPPYQQLSNRSCRPSVTSQFGRISGPFNRPLPQNGRHFVTDNTHHTRGFVPNWPPPNYPAPSLPCMNFPPPNCPPPTHPVPNCLPPAVAFNVVDQHAMPQRPVNTFRQRLPGRLPFFEQKRGFQLKRQLNVENRSGKVHTVITLSLHVK